MDWYDNIQTVVSTKGSVTIYMTIDSNVMIKNYIPIYLDVPAQLIGDYTMVPVRAVAEAFGATVSWNNDTQTVYITYSESVSESNNSSLTDSNNDEDNSDSLYLPIVTATPTPDVDEYRNEVAKLVNKYRKEEGVPAVSLDSTLSEAADVRAKELAKSFSHTRPDGTDCFTILDEYKITYFFACGENIAYGQNDPEDVMNSWMNSSGHRKNILEGDFSQIGIGIYYDNGTYYWVQLFIG